ncbi:MAG: histidinol dehydrogenase [Lachnospiraceae bacterium]|nr:histidinol dehydrogenase [Lachnospiraceae bacterium]
MKIIVLNNATRQEFLNHLKERAPSGYPEAEKTVAEILEKVKNEGDRALFAYAKKFDSCELDRNNFRVSEEEISEALSRVDEKLLNVMSHSMEHIRAFHEKQKRQSFFTTEKEGIFLGQRITPLSRVGVYVPGGKAAYPSSTLMNIVPALVAGVERIVMTTPADKNGRVSDYTLAAAGLTGVKEIYKTGGAQAIAALAFGTESVPKVDKIVGPGNIYVALAKRALFGFVSIDSVAGPSEIMVLADETADPRFAAADLLSQAEHDEMASAILVTTSKELAGAVNREIEALLPKLSRRKIIEESLDRYGRILLAENEEAAIEAVNEIASEHLEIMTKNPLETMSRVKNAGAIFLGPYSSEPLGDYFAGPNHVLPTNGTAKFFSPLSVDDFVKKSSVISYSRAALEAVHEEIESFAEAEGLTAHANSVRIRFE